MRNSQILTCPRFKPLINSRENLTNSSAPREEATGSTQYFTSALSANSQSGEQQPRRKSADERSDFFITQPLDTDYDIKNIVNNQVTFGGVDQHIRLLPVSASPLLRPKKFHSSNLNLNKNVDDYLLPPLFSVKESDQKCQILVSDCYEASNEHEQETGRSTAVNQKSTTTEHVLMHYSQDKDDEKPHSAGLTRGLFCQEVKMTKPKLNKSAVTYNEYSASKPIQWVSQQAQNPTVDHLVLMEQTEARIAVQNSVEKLHAQGYNRLVRQLRYKSTKAGQERLARKMSHSVSNLKLNSTDENRSCNEDDQQQQFALQGSKQTIGRGAMHSSFALHQSNYASQNPYKSRRLSAKEKALLDDDQGALIDWKSVYQEGIKSFEELSRLTDGQLRAEEPKTVSTAYNQTQDGAIVTLEPTPAFNIEESYEEKQGQSSCEAWTGGIQKILVVARKSVPVLQHSEQPIIL